MKPEYKPFVDALIELAIREDIGDGDHTSLSCIPADEHGRMRLLCKQEGIIAGIEIAQVVFHRLCLGRRMKDIPVKAKEKEEIMRKPEHEKMVLAGKTVPPPSRFKMKM